MRKIFTRLISVFLVLSVLAVPVGAKDTEPPFLQQAVGNTCTLCSATMMLRSCMYINGDDRWEQVTEAAVKAYAWTSGGMYWNWRYTLGDTTLSVAQQGCSGISPEQLKALLAEHPEGVVLYCGGGQPHAVFLTDCAGDTFYCADPAMGYAGKRIPLEESLLGARHGNQSGILQMVCAVWYIAEHNIEDLGYLGDCESYPTRCRIRVRWDGYAMTLPATGQQSEESQQVMAIRCGEVYTTIGLYRNPAGDYWYQVDEDFYISAQEAQYLDDAPDDIQLLDCQIPVMVTPSALWDPHGYLEGEDTFVTEGTLKLYSGYGCSGQPVVQARLDGKPVRWEPLSPGIYTCVVEAQYINYYVLDGRLCCGSGRMVLLTQSLRVFDQEGAFIHITLYSADGSLHGQVLPAEADTELGTLPVPQRQGYIFRGWYTQPFGGERVTEHTRFSASRTIYAQWYCDHNYGPWQSDLTLGIRRRVCARCGEEKTERIPVTPGELSLYQILENR